MDEVAAYRAGLALVREAVGPDVYLVGCGAPLLPSVGLVDAMRVSPDTFHEGAEDGSAGLRGLMPLAARAWMQGRLWVNDPDCVVARPSYRLRERWATEAGRFGGLPSFSDRVADLDDWGLATVRGLLADGRLRRPALTGPGARGRRARPGRGVGVTTLDPGALTDRIAPYVELLYPDDDGEVLRTLVALARAVRRGAGRPRGRAAHRADRLPDHLRRRHPAPGRGTAAHPGVVPARPRRRPGQ